MVLPAPAAVRPISVLIVDDSAFMRRAIEKLLAQQPGIAVAGSACNGIEAVQRTLELRPDVITMDVEMPGLDGVGAVREIMQSLPTPIVMLSTRTTEGAETTLHALDAGAVDFIAKPGPLSEDLAGLGDRLGQAIRAASHARVQRRHSAPPQPLRASNLRPPALPNGLPAARVIIIGASTGGPPALAEVITHLPAGLASAVLIVQHLPVGFTGALARRLDTLSFLAVSEASEGDVVSPGRVLVAPGGFHMVVGDDRRVHLNESPSVHGVRPSVDVTLDSVTAVYGRNAAAAILTGMGRDGAEAAARLAEAGGHVFIQDEATCLIYGMPRVTKELTRRAVEAPLDQIAGLLARAFPERSTPR